MSDPNEIQALLDDYNSRLKAEESGMPDYSHIMTVDDLSKQSLVTKWIKAYDEIQKAQITLENLKARLFDIGNECVESGIPMPVLGQAVGITRQRVYQIIRFKR